MRNPFGVRIGILAAGLIFVTGCGGGGGGGAKASSNQCPCGFVWSSPGNGCVVDIWGLNPCFPNGGPPSSSGSPGGDGSSGPGSGHDSGTGNCSLFTHTCNFAPDFKEASFVLDKFDGGSVAGNNVSVYVVAREETSGKPCTQIGGVTAFPSGTKTMTVPLDPSVVGYPGLKVTTHPNCVGSQFTIRAAPEGRPECGCVQTLHRR